MTARSTFVLGLAGLVVAALARSEALVFAAFAVMLLSGLVGIAGRRVLAEVDYTRSFSRRTVHWGGELEVTTTVTNRKWLPLVWLYVRDDWPSAVEPLGFTLRPSHRQARETLAQAFSVRWFQRVRRRHRGVCRQRGVHGFGPAELRATDPLGVVQRSLETSVVDAVVVLPKILDVPALRRAFGRPAAAESARRSLARDPASLVGVRPYRPGDPVRAVNWRAVARTGELYTNEYEPSATADARILLNLRVFEHAWQGVDPDTVELLCVVAASAAAALAEEGFAVGLSSNAVVAGTHSRLDIEPAPGTLPDLLDALARVVPFPAPAFDPVLRDELDDETSDAVRLVVTPTLSGSVGTGVERLREACPVAVVLVGDGDADGAGLADARVPRTFDWRTRDALPLA